MGKQSCRRLAERFSARLEQNKIFGAGPAVKRKSKSWLCEVRDHESRARLPYEMCSRAQ